MACAGLWEDEVFTVEHQRPLASTPQQASLLVQHQLYTSQLGAFICPTDHWTPPLITNSFLSAGNAAVAVTAAAGQAVALALKGMEAKHAAERQLLEQRVAAERNKAARTSEAADAAVSALKSRLSQLRAALVDVALYSYPYGCIQPCEKAVLLDSTSSSLCSSRNVSSTGGLTNSSTAGKAGQRVPLLNGIGGAVNSSDDTGTGLCTSGEGDGHRAGGDSTGGSGGDGAGAGGNGSQSGSCAGGDQQAPCWSPAAVEVLNRVSVLGERWIYMHMPEGPWRKARQLLLQPPCELPLALSRQSSSSSSKCVVCWAGTVCRLGHGVHLNQSWSHCQQSALTVQKYT